MKKVFISLLLFLVLVSTYLGLGPFLALYSIKESIEAKEKNRVG